MTELTGVSFSMAWEVQLMEWLQSHLSPSVISVISFFSAFGEELLLILILGILFWGFDKKLGKAVGLNVLMGLVWNPMVKNIFLRRRPYFDHEGIKILRLVDGSADAYDISAQGFSFPSGHSTDAVALYGSLALKKRTKPLLWLFPILAVLVGLSRVVVGAHYPTDVLAGWALGFFAIGAVSLLRRLIKNDYAFYGALLLTALPGLFYCKSADYFTALGLLVGFIAGAVLEEKLVRFENTKSIPRALLRALGGALLFFGLNWILKLPFSKDFLNSGTYPALIVRAIRYALIAALEFGVYPLVFRYTAQWGAKKNNQ